MSSSTDPEQKELAAVVRRVQQGAVEEYAFVVTALNRRISQEVAWRVPRQEVPELTQEVFIRAYRSLPSYAHRGPFEAWMLQIARRTCQEFWRKRYRSRVCYESDLSEAQQAWVQQVAAEQADRSAIAAEQRETTLTLLQEALGSLSPTDRAVITLLELEDRPVNDVAVKLECGVSAVKVRAHRARNRLRKILERMISAKERQP